MFAELQSSVGEMPPQSRNSGGIKVGSTARHGPLGSLFFSHCRSRAQWPNTLCQRPCVKQMYANSGACQLKWNATCAKFVRRKEVCQYRGTSEESRIFTSWLAVRSHQPLTSMPSLFSVTGRTSQKYSVLSQKQAEEPTFLHCRVCQTLCLTALLYCLIFQFFEPFALFAFNLQSQI